MDYEKKWLEAQNVADAARVTLIEADERIAELERQLKAAAQRETALRTALERTVERWEKDAAMQGAFYASGVFNCASDVRALLALPPSSETR